MFDITKLDLTSEQESHIVKRHIMEHSLLDQIKIISYEIGDFHYERVLKDYDTFRETIKEATARSINAMGKGKVSKTTNLQISPTHHSNIYNATNETNPIIGGFSAMKHMLDDIINGRALYIVDEYGNIKEEVKINKRQAKKYLNTISSPLGLWTMIVVSVRGYGEILLKNGEDFKDAAYLQLRMEAQKKCQNKIRNICISCAKNEIGAEKQAILIREAIKEFEEKIIKELPYERHQQIIREGALHEMTDRKSIIKRTIELAEPLIEDITGKLLLITPSEMINYEEFGI